MKKIKVYCGVSVQDECGKQQHPVNEVDYANRILNGRWMNSEKSEEFVVESNSPDFIMAVKYIGKKKGVETEFFLDGVSYGDSIEEIFKDLNRALDMINELGDTEN